MKQYNKQIILINYTGRHGAGPFLAYEMTKALLEKEIPTAAVISQEVDNLEFWKQLPMEKLVVIPTYSSKVSFLKNHFLFLMYKRSFIKKELQDYHVKAIYCPMCTFWTGPINQLFPYALKIVACHDPVLHTGETYTLANRLLGVNRVYKNADKIIVHTKKFAEYVAKTYHKENEVYYFPLGRHNFYRNFAHKRSVITYDKCKVNFVFFGRISPYKGLDVLADAYKIVFQQSRDVTLTVVGFGDFMPYYEKYNKLEHVTVINRWLKDEEVESIFCGENLIAVLPYVDATQSGVAFTAMDYGIPVIATDTGGLSEQIDDGVTGLLTEPGNVQQLAEQMLRLMNDRNLYLAICKNLTKKTAGMEWDAAADALMEMMEK